MCLQPLTGKEIFNKGVLKSIKDLLVTLIFILHLPIYFYIFLLSFRPLPSSDCGLKVRVKTVDFDTLELIV